VYLLKGIVLQINNEEAIHGYKWLLIVLKGNCWITVISVSMILVADFTFALF